ncbi:MAG: hypothetical protein U1A78_03110 [Polyangia bacterium]
MTPPADPTGADARTEQARLAGLPGPVPQGEGAARPLGGARSPDPLRSLGRDLGLGLLVCILLVLLLLFASGPSGETQGFIYVDF